MIDNQLIVNILLAPDVVPVPAPVSHSLPLPALAKAA